MEIILSEKINKLLAFNNELREMAGTELDKEMSDGNSKSLFVSFAIGKGFKTHEAILLLCKNGYGEDAFMLARTLFELMVTTAYILKDPTDEKLVRYMEYDWVTRKEMYDYVASKDELLEELNKVIESKSNDLQTVAEVKREYDRVMSEYKYDARFKWSDKSIQGMADSVGRLDAYKTVYRIQCTVSHTSARSINEYVKDTDTGTEINIGPSENWVEETLVIAFDFFRTIVEETSKQLNWGLDSRLDGLYKRYAEEVGKLKLV